MIHNILADSVNDILGQPSPPPNIKNLVAKGGAGGISFFLTTLIQVIYIFAGLAVVFMFIIGAAQWILSGGDKEAVAKARARITYAVIGIVLLALTFLILRILGAILGFSFFAPVSPLLPGAST